MEDHLYAEGDHTDAMQRALANYYAVTHEVDENRGVIGPPER